MRKALLGALGAFVFAALIGILVWVGPFRSEGTAGAATTYPGVLSVPEVREFPHFPIYWLGDSFEGHELTSAFHDRQARDRTLPVPEPHGVDAMSFVYGTCEADPDVGRCAPPLSLRIWPACLRNLSSYDPRFVSTPATSPLRGATVARFAGRVEVYTGRVTVVIHPWTLELGMRAAQALQGANALSGLVPPGAALEPPAPGALEGRLSC